MMRVLPNSVAAWCPPFFRWRDTTTNGPLDESAVVDAAPEQAQVLTVSQAVWFVFIAALTSLPALLLGDRVVGQVTALYPLAATASPYFQPAHAGLLYVVAPLVAVSAFALFLLPGAVISLSMGHAKRIESLLAWAFGLSLVLSIALTIVAKLLFGTPSTAGELLGLWLSSSVLASLFLLYRVKQGHQVVWPFSSACDLRRLGWIAVSAFVGVVFLLPKIFWENFNLDGIEAFEYGRSLTNGYLPHWEIFGGVFGFYDNFWLFAYPNHWFITLLGPVEASVRLPFILYLALMLAALLLLIEHGQARRLSLAEESILWLGVVLFAVVQGFNTTYEPFHTDLAESAGTDTLGLLVFLLALYALWTGRQLWFIVFGLMTYSAVPAGSLLLLILGGLLFLAGPLRRWPQWRLAGMVILACLAIRVVYESVYGPLVLGDTASQFSSTNLLRRLYPPTLTEWPRLNVLIFATGLIPAVALFLARRADWRTWTLAGLTLGYFGIVYVQVWSSLHQFTPVMLLPLVVFWRLYLTWRPQFQKWMAPALAATVALCIVLSLPPHFKINLAVREFGLATEYRVGDYQRDYETAAAGSGTLSALLPEDFRFHYPNQPWGADEYSWIYYATREKPPGTETNYLVQEDSGSPPAGFTQIATHDGLGVYVKDLERWQRDQNLEFPRVAISPLYEPILRHAYQFFWKYTNQNRS